jgi:hypothetical protein
MARSMKRRFRHLGIVMCSTGTLLMCAAVPGCAAGVDVALISAAAGAASSAADAGSAVYSAGKLRSVGMLDVESTRTAVLIAADELGLEIEEESEPGPGRYRIVLIDELNTRIYVHLQERTPTMTRLTINMGMFGSEPTARLILKRIAVAVNEHFEADQVQ